MDLTGLSGKVSAELIRMEKRLKKKKNLYNLIIFIICIILAILIKIYFKK